MEEWPTAEKLLSAWPGQEARTRDMDDAPFQDPSPPATPHMSTATT